MKADALTPGRVHAVDFWRGVILVSIFVNHIPGNVFENLTHKNLGFSDATEVFVFLSGISVALAYGRRSISGDMGLPLRAIRRRIITVYSLQMLLSLAAIMLFLSAAFLLDDDGLLADHGRDIVLDRPVKAVLAIAGMSHQIGYFNILPLYVVFLLGTPAILALAKRSPSLMLAVSVCIYLLSRGYGINLPTWPIEGEWFFNPFAWQLLYCTGLAIGFNLNRLGVMRSPALFVLSAIMLVLSLLVVSDMFGQSPGMRDAVREIFDVDKTYLGTVRSLHFLALAYGIFYLRLSGFLKLVPFHDSLCVIGRHSLPVFATGSILAAIGQIAQHAFSLALVDEMLLIACGIVIHYLVAVSFANRRQKLCSAILK